MKRKRTLGNRTESAVRDERKEQSGEIWKLPWGESLEEFALHAGFVGSLLMASQAVSAAGQAPPEPAEPAPEMAVPAERRRNRRLESKR